MAEQKSNPAAVAVLIIIILVALFFIIRQAMPSRETGSAPMPPVPGAPPPVPEGAAE